MNSFYQSGFRQICQCIEHRQQAVRCWARAAIEHIDENRHALDIQPRDSLECGAAIAHLVARIE